MKKTMGIDCNGDAMTTQRQVILDYLMKGNSVSQMEAIEKFGFTRLSAIIYWLKEKLEKDGGEYVVKDSKEKGINRYGNECRYKKYWIENNS